MTDTLFNFLPDEYVVATNSNFIKLPADGQSIKVLIVGPAAIGHSYWTNDKKCIRSKTKFTSTPDIQVREGKTDTPKEFIVFRVLSYDANGGREDGLLEITQLSIKTDIVRILRDPEFWEEDDDGNKQFWTAFKISTAGKGLKTKYKVDAVNVRPVNRPSLDEMQSIIDKYDFEKVLFAPPTEADVTETLDAGEGSNGTF